MDDKLEQFMDFPIQVRGNTLDLILTNVPERVVEVKEVGRLGRSNHVMIQMSIDINMKELKMTRVSRIEQERNGRASGEE
jgi:hypothetical protein